MAPAIQLLRARPRMKSVVDAFQRRRPLSVIREIIRSGLRDDPELLVKRDRRGGGWIPLHHAVHEKAEADVVAYLVQKCPASVRIRTGDSQYLALHIALEVQEPDLRVIRCLVRQWPESVREPSDDGDKYLPLNMAVLPDKSERGAALEYPILRFLVRKYPQALRVKVDDTGWLPIHDLVVYPVRREAVAAARRIVPRSAAREGRLRVSPRPISSQDTCGFFPATKMRRGSHRASSNTWLPSVPRRPSSSPPRANA
jgi:hypothetical protein